MDEFLKYWLGLRGVDCAEMNESQMRAKAAEMGAGANGVRVAADSLVPASLDAGKREVGVVVATESPVQVADYSRWEMVDEVLLMSGCRLGEVRKGRLPLLDSHNRWGAGAVFGSVVDLAVEGGELRGREVWSEGAADVFLKVSEGHLDQRSVGYRVFAAAYVEPGKSGVIGGKTYAAPVNRALKVVTDWVPAECSVVAIGADAAAGTRGFPGVCVKNEERGEKMTEERKEAVSGVVPEVRKDVDVNAGREDGMKAERERAAGIRALGGKYAGRAGVGELVDTAVADGMSLDGFRAALLEKLADASPKIGAAPVRAGMDDVDHLARGAAAGLLMRSNIGGLSKDECEAGAGYRGMSLERIGLALGVRTGVFSPDEAMRMGKREMFGRLLGVRAHTSGDFANVLANVASKAYYAGFADVKGVYESFCLINPVSDFKTGKVVSVDTIGDVPERPDGNETEFGKLGDRGYDVAAKTRAKVLAIGPQALINDDIGVLTRTPFLLGRGFVTALNKAAITQLLALTYTSANTVTGASYSPATPDGARLGLMAGAVKMQKLEGAQGDLLDLMPKGVICGPTYSANIHAGLFVPGPAINVNVDATGAGALAGFTAAANQLLVDMALRLLVTGWVEVSTITNYGTLPYYLFADPNIMPAVILSALDGQIRPKLESEVDFDSDALKIKITGHVGVNAGDPRGVVKVTGAA